MTSQAIFFTADMGCETTTQIYLNEFLLLKIKTRYLPCFFFSWPVVPILLNPEKYSSIWANPSAFSERGLPGKFVHKEYLVSTREKANVGMERDSTEDLIFYSRLEWQQMKNDFGPKIFNSKITLRCSSF